MTEVSIYSKVVMVSFVEFELLMLFVVLGAVGVVHTLHLDEDGLQVYVYPETEKQLAEVNVLGSTAVQIPF
jgi:hypothetical protein